MTYFDVGLTQGVDSHIMVYNPARNLSAIEEQVFSVGEIPETIKCVERPQKSFDAGKNSSHTN